MSPAAAGRRLGAPPHSRSPAGCPGPGRWPGLFKSCVSAAIVGRGAIRGDCEGRFVIDRLSWPARAGRALGLSVTGPRANSQSRGYSYRQASGQESTAATPLPLPAHVPHLPQPPAHTGPLAPSARPLTRSPGSGPVRQRLSPSLCLSLSFPCSRPPHRRSGLECSSHALHLQFTGCRGRRRTALAKAGDRG